MEVELSIISDATDHVHKVLDRNIVDAFTTKAQEEIEQEEMELA